MMFLHGRGRLPVPWSRPAFIATGQLSQVESGAVLVEIGVVFAGFGALLTWARVAPFGWRGIVLLVAGTAAIVAGAVMVLSGIHW